MCKNKEALYKERIALTAGNVEISIYTDGCSCTLLQLLCIIYFVLRGSQQCAVSV